MEEKSKINILFVDDEADVINGLKRMLFSMRSSWNLFFCLNGFEALEILSKNKIDVMVTDMRMPGMDGAELLNKVKELYPQILRMVLSGHINEIEAVKSTISAHQFLSKPCDANTIKTVIEKSVLMRTYLNNKDLIKVINGIGELPTMPDLYIRLEHELQKSEVSFEKVEEIIADDPAITAKILQTVNSGFFGLSINITNLLQAISYLGINTIKSLVLYLKTYTIQNMSDEAVKFCELVGRHSFEVACLAKSIMKSETKNRDDQDNAFIIGILHDIGKLILLNTPNYLSLIKEMSYNKTNTQNFVTNNKLEFEKYGFTHAEAGAYLLGIWGFSEYIIEAVALHHKPSNIYVEEFSCLSAVHVANSIINTRNMGIFPRVTEEKGKERNNEILAKELFQLDVTHISDIKKLDNLYNWWNIYQQFEVK